MKTIKNIADEIDVTKQAVFKKIKTEPFKTKISKHLHTVGNVINIDEEGEALIKKEFEKTSYKRVTSSPRKKNKETEYIEKIFVLETQIKLLEGKITSLEEELKNAHKSPEANRELLDILKTQLEQKDKQLEAKDVQILNTQEQARESIVATKQTAAALIKFQLNPQQPATPPPPPVIEPAKDLITYKEDAIFTSPKMEWLKKLAKKKTNN